MKGLSFPVKLLDAMFTAAARPHFTGFLEGHAHLTESDWAELSDLLEHPDETCTECFEKAFAAQVGNGQCVSFAAGRMAFHSLLEHLGIGAGDTVVLTGFTCSVMANAVVKTGARIIFCDIDSDTLGTSPVALERVLTDDTRLIVAQHSFGIPCEIAAIAEIARRRGIFLLEDCAIALGSSAGGTVIGNVGDAAIFSTDHSKPVNTLTGGLFYARDGNLVSAIRAIQANSPVLPLAKCRAILRRLRVEARLCKAGAYARFPLREALARLGMLVPGRSEVSPFLDEDQGTTGPMTYPYPSRLPSFLAGLGLVELKRWPETAQARARQLQFFLAIAREEGLAAMLPGAYFREDVAIIPLRLAWSQQSGEKLRRAIRRYVDTEQTWFLSPIISTHLSPEQFGYAVGSCPVAESTGHGMVNVPITLPEAHIRRIVQQAVNAGESEKNDGRVLQE